MKFYSYFLCVLIFSQINSIVAQSRNGCNYTGQHQENEIKCTISGYKSDGDAEKIVDAILSEVGLVRNFLLYECPGLENAIAFNEPKPDGEVRVIAFDRNFLNRINLDSNTDWAALSILAHEVGHHLNGHALIQGGSRPDFELEADKFSGFILGKLGATLDEAQAAMKEVQTVEGSLTHPPLALRLSAIHEGYENAVDRKKEKIATATIEQIDFTSLAIQQFELGKQKGPSFDRIEHFKRAIKYKPAYFEALFNLGFEYESLNQLDSAEYFYDFAIRTNNKSAKAYNNRGVVQQKLGRPIESCLVDMDKAIQLDSTYTKAYNNRGAVYLEFNQFDLAIKDFTKAISMDSKYASAYCNRAIAYERTNDVIGAVYDYDAALKIEPNYSLALANKGCMFVKMRKFQQAIELLYRALELNNSLLYAKDCLKEAMNTKD
jgi:tetratricopeptide (TPR) repeat protein